MITLTLNCANVDELHQTIRNILKGEPSTRPYVGFDPAMPGADKTVETQFHRNAEAETNAKLSPEKYEPKLVPKDDSMAGFAVDAQPEKEKKTRTRKPKETKPQEMNEAVALEPFETIKQESNSSPSLEVNASIPTKDQVHQALQQVNVALGLPAAREILKKFNVQRQSEIQPSQYRPFIEECNNVVAMS